MPTAISEPPRSETHTPQPHATVLSDPAHPRVPRRLAPGKHPAVGTKLSDRHAGQPPEAIAIAWSTQRRLHHVWSRLEQRAKRRTTIAVARELAGFCWAICQIE